MRAELDANPSRSAHVHLDLDCLDTSVGLANEYAAPGALSTEALSECMEVVARSTIPLGMTIASFNPDLAGNSAIAAAGIRADQIITAAAGSHENA